MTALQLQATESSQKTVHLIIAGATGRVGTALREQIGALESKDIRLEPIILANSRETKVSLNTRRIDFATDWRATIALLRREKTQSALFVDCTASEEVASLYPELLRNGVGIVTPNKIASSGPLSQYLEIRDIAARRNVPYLHETTVGAALPLLRTIRELVGTGDTIRSIEAVLSGTLSYVLARVHDGVAFSEAVREAHELGFTEPDPTVDLSGGDVGRKLLILLREAGYAFYGSAVDVDSLVPERVKWDGDIDRFVEALRPHDASWKSRADDAAGRGKRLVYAATFDGARARAGVLAAGRDTTVARTRAGENVVVIHTDRYAKVPLTISGPGAGPDVTASGLLAEVLSAAATWSAAVPVRASAK